MFTGIEILTKLIDSLVSVAWVVFCFWIATRLLRLLPKNSIGDLVARIKGIEAGPMRIDLDPADKLLVTGIAKAINIARDSGDARELASVLRADLPRLKEALSSSPIDLPQAHEGNVADDQETTILSKIRDMVAQLTSPDAWIDDYIFVSGSYGYNFWRTEIETMIKRGWIEIDGARIRMTAQGLAAARAAFPAPSAEDLSTGKPA
jgi:hypothetical protein